MRQGVRSSLGKPRLDGATSKSIEGRLRRVLAQTGGLLLARCKGVFPPCQDATPQFPARPGVHPRIAPNNAVRAARRNTALVEIRQELRSQELALLRPCNNPGQNVRAHRRFGVDSRWGGFCQSD